MNSKTTTFQHQLIMLILLIWLCCGLLVETARLRTDDCAEMYHNCTHPRSNNSSRLSPTEMTEKDFLKSRCFCDDDCWKFGDCCSDADSAQKTKLHWTCETVSPNFEHPTYAIGYCPDDWTDKSVNLQCNKKLPASSYHYLLDVPVYSKRKGRFYSNMFCAACHNDSELSPVILKINCGQIANCTDKIKTNGTYQPGKLRWEVFSAEVTLQVVNYTRGNSSFENGHNSAYPRRCYKTIDTCALDWTDSSTAAKCNGFAKYVQEKLQMFKNEYCAKCNYENKTTCKETLYIAEARSDFSFMSYDLLMDFSIKPPSRKRTKCLYDEIYDPIMKKCIPSPCGKNAARVKGNCISIPQVNSTDTKSCSAYVVLTADVLIFENGSIFVNDTEKTHDINDFLQYNETTYLICSDPDDDLYFIRIGGVHSRLSIACMSISLISLAAHIIIHSIVGQLDKLPGKNLLNLSVALFMAQLLFFIGVNRTEHFGLCFAIGVAIHFFFLAVFFWMNVMALDICWTFTCERYRPNYVRRKRTFYLYLAYAWIIPLIIVICGILADRTRMLPTVQPNYGIQLCWISNRYGLLIFFALPLAILLLENIMLFVVTAYWIYQTTKDCRDLKKPSECSRFYLYLKLAFIMGLTWVLGFVAALTDFKPLWYGFIILNASQGTFIFVVFTLKRRIMRQLCEKLTGKTPAAFRTQSSDSKRTSVLRLSASKGTSPEQTNMLSDEETTEIH